MAYHILSRQDRRVTALRAYRVAMFCQEYRQIHIVTKEFESLNLLDVTNQWSLACLGKLYCVGVGADKACQERLVGHLCLIPGSRLIGQSIG